MSGRTAFRRDDTLFEILRSRRETGDLRSQFQERKQRLEALRQRQDELLKDVEKTRDLLLNYDIYIKDRDSSKAAEKAEKKVREVTGKEAKKERLKEEYAEVKTRKRELLRQVKRNSLYQEFMQQVVKMTKFENIDAHTGHLENLLHIKHGLCRRESAAEEKADQHRKVLLTLEDQHHLLRLRRNNQLSRLQTELEKTCSEAELWETRWNRILETAAKKTLLLGQIKLVTLSLYESVVGNAEEDKGVTTDDAEAQLEKIRIFIEDHEDILRKR